MRRNVIKLTAFALLFLSFGACKKSSSGNTAKSKPELLTQSAWRTTNQEFGNGSSWIQNPDWSDAQPCEKDNLLIFKSNMTWEETEGATKCDAADDQVIDGGTWAWQDSETKIKIDGMEGTINQLDNNTLQVTSQLNATMYLRVTYTH